MSRALPYLVALLFLEAIVLQVADLAVTEYFVSTDRGVELNPLLQTFENRLIAKVVAVTFLLVLLVVLPADVKPAAGLIAVFVSVVPFVFILVQVGVL